MDQSTISVETMIPMTDFTFEPRGGRAAGEKNENIGDIQENCIAPETDMPDGLAEMFAAGITDRVLDPVFSEILDSINEKNEMPSRKSQHKRNKSVACSPIPAIRKSETEFDLSSAQQPSWTVATKNKIMKWGKILASILILFLIYKVFLFPLSEILDPQDGVALEKAIESLKVQTETLEKALNTREEIEPEWQDKSNLLTLLSAAFQLTNNQKGGQNNTRRSSRPPHASKRISPTRTATSSTAQNELE